MFQNSIIGILAMLFVLLLNGCLPKNFDLIIDSDKTTNNRLYTIAGRVKYSDNQNPALYHVLVNNRAATRTPLNSDGSFSVEKNFLTLGDNILKISLLQNEATIVTQEITVLFAPDGVVYDFYRSDSSSTTSVSILDRNNPAYGASISISPGSLDIPKVPVSIVNDPDHVGNLPVNIERVGPSISFQPIGQKFTPALRLAIPYDVDLVSNKDDVRLTIYADSDNGWVELPHLAITSTTINFEVPELFYDNFTAVLAPEKNK